MKRRGKSPPVIVVTQSAVHVMGCKAKYTASPKGRELPAPERLSGAILAGGRLQEADGDIRPRSMTECKTEPGLQVCVFFFLMLMDNRQYQKVFYSVELMNFHDPLPLHS